MELEAGAVVAQRYRVLRQLGRGGMGEVFAAENVRTGRTVAVKVLRADSKQKSSAVERFRREARAAGAISSDYVTQVLDVEDDPEHGIIIVFELLEGESLIDRLKRTGPMTFEELFPVVEQVWMGLADAHKSGVIHRDLKPSNVFLERRPDGKPRVKILDFGISKLPREVGGETLTEMGQSLGTFSFMPPEQIGKAKTVDHRADIYACATLIYQAMSGQLPYGAKNILQMVDLKTKSEPRALASVLDGPVDPRLEAFLAKGLARDPGARFQSAAEALEVWRSLRIADPASQGPSSIPRYQGAAAPAQAAPQAQVVPPANRAPATVMMADPRMMSGSPLPVQNPASYGGQQQPRPGFGTVAIQNPGSKAGAINVPVMNDTSSEGAGDQVATIAMPMRNVAAALAGAGIAPKGPTPNSGLGSSGLPRMHDDSSTGSPMGGTQLMSHASLRQAGVPIPQRMGPPTPMPGGQYQPASSPQPSSANPSHGSGPHTMNPALQAQIAAQNAQPQGGEGADLTTVYRRDKSAASTSGSQPIPPTERGGGRSVGMVLGVIAFALVGFGIAAVVIRYLQTGQFIWQ